MFVLRKLKRMAAGLAALAALFGAPAAAETGGPANARQTCAAAGSPGLRPPHAAMGNTVGWSGPYGSWTNSAPIAWSPACQTGDPRCAKPPADLSIWKAPRGQSCSPDGLCGFVIGIGNAGTTAYRGPVSFRDRVAAVPPTWMAFAPSPPWTCSSIGPGVYQCDHPGVALAPGGFLDMVVNVIAPHHPNDTLDNCAALRGVANETNLINNEACASIKLRETTSPAPSPQQCTVAGQVVVDGQCVCPEGAEALFGACVVPPPAPSPPPQCTVAGQVVVDGHCVCPEGTEALFDACVVPPPAPSPPPQCTVAGQVVVDGQCVCPEGTEARDGACFAPPPAVRPPTPQPRAQCRIRGQIVVDGDCVCPRGETATDGACRRPAARRAVKSRPVAKEQCVCPNGTQLVDGVCRVPAIAKPPKARQPARSEPRRGTTTDVFEFLKR